jgi:hypothetical protein
MKQYALIFLFLFSAYLSHAQTYIGPIIGIDALNMEVKQNNPHVYRFNIVDTGYFARSAFYGIKLEQVIFKKLSLSFETSYTEKSARALIFTFAAHDGFVYKYYQNRLSARYEFWNFLSVGAGYDFNKLKNLRYTLVKRVSNEFIPVFYDKGISLSVGVHWKNIELNSYFHRGLNSNSDRSGLNLYPIKTIGLHLGYRFKVWRGFGKRPAKYGRAPVGQF